MTATSEQCGEPWPREDPGTPPAFRVTCGLPKGHEGSHTPAPAPEPEPRVYVRCTGCGSTHRSDYSACPGKAWERRAIQAEEALAEAEETIDNYDLDTVAHILTVARQWRDRQRARTSPIPLVNMPLLAAIDRLDRDEDPEEHGTPTETGATDAQGRCTVGYPPAGPDGRCGSCGRQRA